jgi:hypothetical protein
MKGDQLESVRHRQPRGLPGEQGLLLGAGPGGSFSSSVRASPSTKSLMTSGWYSGSSLPRGLKVVMRSRSWLERWKKGLTPTGLALPERESPLPPEPQSLVFSRAVYDLRPFPRSPGLAQGEPFRSSATKGPGHHGRRRSSPPSLSFRFPGTRLYRPIFKLPATPTRAPSLPIVETVATEIRLFFFIGGAASIGGSPKAQHLHRLAHLLSFFYVVMANVANKSTGLFIIAALSML